MATIQQPAVGGGDPTPPLSLVPAGTGKISDTVFLCPVYADDLGAPVRAASVAFLTTSTLQLNTFSLKGGQWVFTPGLDAQDSSIAIGVTATNFGRMHCFGIQGPGTSSDLVVFIMTHDAAGAPDTFVIRSITIADGATSLTAVAVTIAGANAPPDTNDGGAMSVPIGTNRIMTFFQDDIYFGDITGSGPFTITYTDAPVLAWDTNMDVSVASGKRVFAHCIGTRVVVLRSGSSISTNLPFTPGLWELDTAGAVVKTRNPWHGGGMGSNLELAGLYRVSLFAERGAFMIATPFATNDSSRSMATMLTLLPIDDV